MDKEHYLYWIRKKHTALGDSEEDIIEIISLCEKEFDVEKASNISEFSKIYNRILEKFNRKYVDSFSFSSKLNCNSNNG